MHTVVNVSFFDQLPMLSKVGSNSAYCETQIEETTGAHEAIDYIISGTREERADMICFSHIILKILFLMVSKLANFALHFPTL